MKALKILLGGSGQVKVCALIRRDASPQPWKEEVRNMMVGLMHPDGKGPVMSKCVVAVYVKESWWTTEDVLRTSDPAREGLMKVQSFGERIVLFILNVVIFGRLERNLDDDDMFFLPHSVKEEAKILWRDGAAVGFYTTKRKGKGHAAVWGHCHFRLRGEASGCLPALEDSLSPNVTWRESSGTRSITNSAVM
eukprot:bmy_06117T0